MFALPIIAFFLLTISVSSTTRNIYYIILRGAVLFTAITVLACELLSLFSLYSFWPLTFYWLAVIAIILFFSKKFFLKNLLKIWALRPKDLVWQEWLSIFFLMFFIIITFITILLYPPSMNFDANVYHMPRVFFWLNNASVHNYPTDINLQLAMGPLPSFFVAQFQALLNGNDALAGLVQWFAYIGSMLCVAGISQQLGATRKSQFYAAILAATVPMSILQAVTTQTDLFLSFWILVVIYFVVYFIKNETNYEWALLLGLSVGFTLLAKLSSVAILFPFAILIAIFCLRKQTFKHFCSYAAVVFACVLLICGGFFIRNALEFNGDFLALGPIGGSAISIDSPKERLVATVMNLSRNFTFNNNFVSGTIQNGVLKLIKGLDVTINEDVSQGINANFCFNAFDTFLVPPNEHNIATNPFHIYILSGVGLLILFFNVFTKKKKDVFLLFYFSACALSYVLVCSLIVYTSSISRYLLPSLLAGLAVIPVFLQKGKFLKIALSISLICTVCLHIPLLFFNSTQPVFINNKIAQILKMNIFQDNYLTSSRRDLRAVMIKLLYSNSWDQQAYDRMISEVSKYKKIGVANISGEYSLLYLLRGKEYDVRHFDLRVHEPEETFKFEPEAIIVGDRFGLDANAMSSIETKYRLAETCGGLHLYICEKAN